MHYYYIHIYVVIDDRLTKAVAEIFSNKRVFRTDN